MSQGVDTGDVSQSISSEQGNAAVFLHACIGELSGETRGLTLQIGESPANAAMLHCQMCRKIFGTTCQPVGKQGIRYIQLGLPKLVYFASASLSKRTPRPGPAGTEREPS